ncbi:MAG: IS3 family transposase [Chloroflexota bacterium]|nr:IS3 family transposase [Chloroflexota bacterium]
MKQALPTTSTRCICRALGVARSALYRHRPAPRSSASISADADLVARIKERIEQHPTYGYRRIWARLRFGDKRVINRKKVRRLMRQQGWMVCQRPATPKPRVRWKKSIATRRNERWALDATHIDCGVDGWGHLIAVIDCYDREIVGWEFALRGRANEAERALEMACLARFGTLRPCGDVPTIRSDNGLIFQSRRFREACRFYRLPQAFITPYTPEQNGVIERWFRSLKEECVWQQWFHTFQEAQTAISRWIRWYNAERPHHALGYQSPQGYGAQHEVPPAGPNQCLRAASLGSAADEGGHVQARGAAAPQAWMKKALQWFDKWGALQVEETLV